MRRRGGAALAVTAMLILLGIYVATVRRLSEMNDAGRIAVLTVPSAPVVAPAGYAARIADAPALLANDPMNQRLVNTAMLASRARRGSPDQAWFVTLARLGWRDTPSRQNLLVRHAQRSEIVAALDDIDALLRRNQLIEEIAPVLLSAEADPLWRMQVVQRLQQRPSWRFGYLQRGSLIDDPALLAARATTIRTLQRRGDDVAVGEIAPLLPKLLAADLERQAYEIWRAREPSIAQPVADPDFSRLAREQQPSAVPFHWHLTNGPDYGAYVESSPAPHLTLSWNGVGAPVFATQHIARPPGRYAVILTTPQPGADLAMVGVRVICGNDGVDAQPRRLSATRVAYAANRAIACFHPRLELYGRPAMSGPRDRQAAIAHVAIAPAI